MYRCLPICVLLATICWHGCVFATDGPASQDVFVKQLAGGDRLLVVRKPIEQPADLNLLLPARWHDVDKKAYHIAVTLRSTGGKDTEVASRVQIETGAPNSGLSVLSAIIDDKELMIVFGVGSRLCLWQITLGSLSEDHIMELSGWQISARAEPVTPGIADVSVSRMPDGRWAASVVDKRIEPQPSPAVFEQAQGTRQMILVRGGLRATKP